MAWCDFGTGILLIPDRWTDRWHWSRNEPDGPVNGPFATRQIAAETAIFNFKAGLDRDLIRRAATILLDRSVEMSSGSLLIPAGELDSIFNHDR